MCVSPAPPHERGGPVGVEQGAVWILVYGHVVGVHRHTETAAVHHLVSLERN